LAALPLRLVLWLVASAEGDVMFLSFLFFFLKKLSGVWYGVARLFSHPKCA
jgi:hypothetical protein